jgi:queuine tRNA-ribosyltransferase
VQFEITHVHSASRARCGRLSTPHGAVDTPVFMPVGTRASVKGLTPEQVAATGSAILLANTYHLLLRPGPELIHQQGGLHAFMGWSGPLLTDSGGFQVFSLSELARIEDGGVVFRSHIDGARCELTPEAAIRAQNHLGADIIMAFDHCPAHPCPPAELAEAVRRTCRWARRCAAAHQRHDQALFGIVQGGVDPGLRRQCAEEICSLDLPGHAIGGLSVGETHEQMCAVLSDLTPLLPAGRPRYLMGVGMPRDIAAAVACGVDMFDCVLPTRNGRNAYAFTAQGPLRLRNQQHRDDPRPLEEHCDCYACTRFSRSYIRHLFLVDEMLGPILVTIHNLRFFQRFMGRMRTLIVQDAFQRIYDEFAVAR